MDRSRSGAVPPWVTLSTAVVMLVAGIVVVGARERTGPAADQISAAASVATLTVHDPAVHVRRNAAIDFAAAPSGTALAVGDGVRTDEAGFGQVDWFEGSLTRIDVSTEIVIDRLAAAAPRRVRLRMDVGRTWNRIEGLTGDDRFEVETPVAVATVRGTIFVVHCPVRDTCTVIVIRGRVVVTAKDGREIEVGTASNVTIGPDGPGPVEPVDVQALFAADEWLRRNAELDDLLAALEEDLLARGRAGDAGPEATPAPTPAPTPTPPIVTTGPRVTPRPTPAPTPSQPRIGPGPKMVYASARNSLDVVVRFADGTSVVHEHPAKDYAPVLSPDGGQIAFASERDGNREIYVMNVDGSGVRRLTNDPADDEFPTWVGTQGDIAFHSDRTGNSQIYAINQDGSGLRRLTNNAFEDTYPAGSIEGDIAFVSSRDGNAEIYRMASDGSNQTRMTNDPATDTRPAWNPGGTLVAFSSDRTAGFFDVFVADLRGNQSNRTNSLHHDSEPDWSVDGTAIAFTSDRDGLLQIYTMQADGTNQTNFSGDLANPDEDPSWGP